MIHNAKGEIKFDCIFVPGGGLLEDGSLPPWVIARLDRAARLVEQTTWVAALSGGTVHKPPPLDQSGFPLFESRQAASYLISRGIDPGKLLTETISYDTIGNAYFARILFAEPFSMERLHLLTSEFHLPRTEAIFRWIFSLAPVHGPFELSFESVPDQGLSPQALLARTSREQHSLAKVRELMESISSLDVFQHWLYREHAAYSVTGQKEQLSEAELNSY